MCTKYRDPLSGPDLEFRCLCETFCCELRFTVTTEASVALRRLRVDQIIRITMLCAHANDEEDLAWEEGEEVMHDRRRRRGKGTEKRRHTSYTIFMRAWVHEECESNNTRAKVMSYFVDWFVRLVASGLGREVPGRLPGRLRKHAAAGLDVGPHSVTHACRSHRRVRMGFIFWVAESGCVFRRR